MNSPCVSIPRNINKREAQFYPAPLDRLRRWQELPAPPAREGGDDPMVLSGFNKYKEQDHLAVVVEVIGV